MGNLVLEKHLAKQGIPEGKVLPRLLSNLENSNHLTDEEKRKVRHSIFVLLHRANHGKDKKSASALTAIFNDSVKYILSLSDFAIHDLKELAQSEIYRSLTSIYSLYKKFPPSLKDDAKNLLEWCTENGVVNFELLRSITGMMHGRGMPKEEDIKNLKKWCTENGVVNFDLLRSVTGMQAGRGMPKKEDIENLKEWCQDESGKVNFELLRSITGMMNGRGMPKEEDIENLKEWCQDESGKVNFELLRSITGMQAGRGMPKKEDIENLKEWCQDESGKVNFELLQSITGMMNGRGMPKEEDIENLKSWCGGYNDLFRYISGKQEGIPTHERFLQLQQEFLQKNPS